jgi:hypothetical protein
LTTAAIAALANRGFSIEHIGRLYPDQSREALAEAIDLERSLAA